MTRQPGMPQSMGPQSVGHNLLTEQQQRGASVLSHPNLEELT